jgi:hypothetical protein
MHSMFPVCTSTSPLDFHDVFILRKKNKKIYFFRRTGTGAGGKCPRRVALDRCITVCRYEAIPREAWERRAVNQFFY